MILDKTGPFPQAQNIFIRNTEPLTILGGNRKVLHHLASADIVDQLELLASQGSLKNRSVSAKQSRFENVELIGIDRSLNDVFTEAPRRVDHHGVAESGFGVDRKHHT